MRNLGMEGYNAATQREEWSKKNYMLLTSLKAEKTEELIKLARSSHTRIYKELDYSKGLTYCNQTFSRNQITWIMKARGDLLWLNGSRFNEARSRLCSLCNLNEEEDINHFLGRCPVLRELRCVCFEKATLEDNEIISVLDGLKGWNNLALYVEKAINYRKFLVNEFNF